MEEDVVVEVFVKDDDDDDVHDAAELLFDIVLDVDIGVGLVVPEVCAGS